MFGSTEPENKYNPAKTAGSSELKAGGNKTLNSIPKKNVTRLRRF